MSTLFEKTKVVVKESKIYICYKIDFEFHIQLTTWSPKIGLYTKSIRNKAHLIDFVESVISNRHVIKNSIIPINLQVQSWEKVLKILHIWLINPKVNQVMKVVINIHHSRSSNCLLDKINSLKSAPK